MTSLSPLQILQPAGRNGNDPVLSAVVSGVPLQAGLAPGNSLHDFPVSPADITQNRCVGPDRAAVFTPMSDTLTIRV